MTIRQWVCISMSAYPQVLLAVLVFASAASCKTALESPFKPAQGWILVKNGRVSDIGAAIRDYDGLARDERPGVFRVELHPQTDGSVAVVLPDGFPAYHLANMTGWLSAPPDLESVHGAHSWITAPGDGIKSYLEPETSNAWGDTLIGASTLGRSIRVFLPETGISETFQSRTYREEPQIQISPLPVTMEVTLDTNTAFGNPRFTVNRPMDHDWHR